MGTMKSGTMMLVLLLAIVLHPDPGLAYDADACIGCHDLSSTRSRLTIDVAAFEASIHGENAACTDCHGRVVDERHATSPGSGAVTCTPCHDRENRHGLGGTRQNRPDCYHCHTRHHILGANDPASSIHPKRLEQTCAGCHPAQSGRVGYFSWLPSLKIATHPKADFSGGRDMANCTGCHQGRASHGGAELISDDKCHRCHLSADNHHNPMLGVMHPLADPARQDGVFTVAVVYQVFLGMLLAGGMCFFIRKFSGTP